MTAPPRRASQRSLAALAAGLGLLTALSRIPFRSRTLFAWDSANFALALDRYNVAFHQPQPPGYPVYVASARVLHALMGDANAAYVWLSVVASGLAVTCLTLAADRLYGRRTAVLAAVLLATSSLLWGQGVVAYPYAFLTLFSALVAWLCMLIRESGAAWLVPVTAGAIALGAGFRSELLPFLSPLWLYASLSARRSLRDRLTLLALGFGVMGIVVLAWYVPMVVLSGGWSAYQAASGGYYAYFIQTTSGAGKLLLGVLENTRALVGFLYNGLGLALMPMVYFIGRYFSPPRVVADARVRFVLLWLGPPLVFYVTVHIGNPGYVLSLLPALSVYAAEAVLGLLEDVREALRSRGGWVLPAAGLAVAAIGVSNTALFFAANGEGRWKEISQIDRIFERQLAEIRRAYPPESTLIVAYDRSRQYRYYLPQHKIELLFDVAVAGAVTDTSRYWERRTTYRVPPGIAAVVFPDLGRNTSDQPGLVERVDLGAGVDLFVARVRPGDEVRYGYQYASAAGGTRT
ncbi:MAG TPA: glycosyltransferase family 39 protein [Chloroflexota bacterium]|nr:glycosyltransferase family 39 protein [Chloroflexota bacterium]